MTDINKFDLIVIGGGPGGATTAIRARHHGLNVLLIDKKKFPRDKVCGDALSGKSVTVLRKLELLDKVAKLESFQANSVIFGAPSGKEINIKFKHSDPNEKSYGFVLRRYVYDKFLLDEAKGWGTNVKENHSFKSLIFDEVTDQVTGVKANNENGEEIEFNAPLVVGADGFGSKVAFQIGSVERNPKFLMSATRSYYKGVKDLGNSIELHFLDELKWGYFWIFPMADGIANVGLGIRKDSLNSSENTLIQLQEQVISSTRFKDRFIDVEIEGKISGWTLPTGNTWRKLYGNGVMLVGDAAGLIDPFTGEGIGNAMTSGYLAADIAYKASLADRYDDNYLKEYETTLKKKIAAELKTSSNLQTLSGYKFLLNLVIGKAAANEDLRDFISGMIANEKTKEELKSPLFYLKLLFK